MSKLFRKSSLWGLCFFLLSFKKQGTLPRSCVFLIHFLYKEGTHLKKKNSVQIKFNNFCEQPPASSSSRNFNYYCHCTLYSKGHFDSCCSKSFFFFFLTAIEMGLVDNSILFPIKALALKCTDKYYEMSIWLTIWGIKIAFVKLCFSKIMS